MAIGTEYVHQRPNLEWYLGIARGLGINVHLAPYGSAVLAGPVYAIDTAAPIFLGDVGTSNFAKPAEGIVYINEADVPND